jgi:hypothetical protein
MHIIFYTGALLSCTTTFEFLNEAKHEIRISKSERIRQIIMTKKGKRYLSTVGKYSFLSFYHLNLVFVSDFDIRASNFESISGNTAMPQVPGPM